MPVSVSQAVSFLNTGPDVLFMDLGWGQLRLCGQQVLLSDKQTERLGTCGPWEPDEASFPCHQHHHRHHSCRLSPAGCSPPGARRCELFQAQISPASTAIEFCFHYAGFLGSFKLILILSSLLRPLKRAVFPPSLVHWGLSHCARPAPSLARAACPSSPLPPCARPVGLQTSKLWAALHLGTGKGCPAHSSQSTPTWV